MSRRNLELLREEKRKQVEALLAQAAQAARTVGIPEEELCELIRLLYKDE